MFDHIGLKVTDVAVSARFFDAALTPLGFVSGAGDASSASFGPPGAPALWLGKGTPAASVHIAFRAPDHAAVRAFHANGLAAGGRDNGLPGPRPDYGPTYFAAFLIDPDGNNVEAVCLTEAT